MAHVRAVAKQHADKTPTETATLAQTGTTSYKQLCGGRKARKVCHDEGTARAKADRDLETALGHAFTLVDEARP